MTTRWPNATLGDHVDLLTGFAFKSRDFTDCTDDIRLLRGANIGQGHLKWQQERRLPRSMAAEYRRFDLAADDIVLAMDRPWIEAGLKWCSVRESDLPLLLVQRVARLRALDSMSQDYLKYLIGSPQFESYVRPIVTGVNIPHISPKQICRFAFKLPPRDIQAAVARLLRPIEELTDNNRRLIDNLEEMAQLVYQEWFVHLRYPGHEGTGRGDSELGPIPNGWEVLPISQVVESIGGGTPSRRIDDYWVDGNIRWFTPSDLTRHKSAFVFDSSEKISEQGLKQSSAKMFPAGSVMLTSRATIGEISIAAAEASTNQGFITCVPSDRLTTNYLYFWLLENVPLFESLAGGATFKELRKSTFRELPILVPDRRVIVGFEERVGPMMALVANLLRQNAVLRATRDLLLPRLVSGDLDVSGLGSELGAVGA